ncbi:MAG TPA: arsenosugar biosynthesis radical SAM (seleno)protein ArsS [Chthoniobacterales bacterium]|jgi:radical SAM/Cys-rich protein
MSRFAATLQAHGLELRHARTEILQINVGKLCNLTCNHCHVNAGPKRKEIITRETIDQILAWLEKTDIGTVDLTGGAPEMIPDFRYFVSRVRGMGRKLIDRCNLTILLEPGFEGTAEFLAEHEVEIVASMPCYSRENVDAQRGNGVFQNSIAALRLLNSLGYGINPKLPLHLVYNPGGAFLPGPQAELHADYTTALLEDFGIRFNNLFTITNMPISRFASWLKHSGELEGYEQLLFDSFNPTTVDGLMCRNTLNIGWRGEVYDCDFNQMLGMQWRNGSPTLLWDLDPERVENRPILIGDHCFGCTAGCGSSCGGALT